jgi:glucose-6-phosphate dehydrogenase assembly protein OpcA
MTSTFTPAAGEDLPLSKVEEELTRQLDQIKEPNDSPVRRARMSNLVIFCNEQERARQVAGEVPAIVSQHPARVLLLLAEPDGEPAPVTASVATWCQRASGGGHFCSEQVMLRAHGQAVEHLPFAVRELLIGDLPTNLLWAATKPPPLAGPILYDLAERVQQVIYDSIGWTEPARCIAATASWLEKFERPSVQGNWRVASDLNWRRLKYWRRLLAQALDPASAPGALESITEVVVEHGPHAVMQGVELGSWMASRLGWRIQDARIQLGVEIVAQVAAPHGQLRLRLRRLAEGHAEIRKVRIACTLEGKPGALNLVIEDQNRLAVIPEGIAASPRTMITQPQSFAELVARQLSDRERDPVFRESMAVAQAVAQTLLSRAS